MENEVVTIDNDFRPNQQLEIAGNTAIAAHREAQSALGMIMAAKHFPRDKFTAVNNIIEACQRYDLAKSATYSFPRGGNTVSGPSIRLAEVIAQCWGNLDYGTVELERKGDVSVCESYCWDLQTNTRKKLNFTVSHYRDSTDKVTKQKIKTKLTDERDIYEAVANYGSRRTRNCILAIIPGDVQDKAISVCNSTLAKGPKNMTLEDRIIGIVNLLSSVGVPQVAIEKKLNHEMKICTVDEVAELYSIYNSIKDAMTKRTDWFDLGGAEVQSEDTKELNEKFKPDSKKQ